MFETWYQTQALVKSGRVDLRIRSSRTCFPRREFARAFELMANGEAAKSFSILKESKLTTMISGVRREAARRPRRAQESGHVQALAAPDDADGPGSAYGRGRRRHRALEQQLLRACRPSRSDRRRESAGSSITAPAPRRCALSAERSTFTARWKSGSRSFWARKRRSRTSPVGTPIPDCLQPSATRDRRSSPTSSITPRSSTASGWRQSAARALQAQQHGRTRGETARPSRVAFRSSS